MHIEFTSRLCHNVFIILVELEVGLGTEESDMSFRDEIGAGANLGNLSERVLG